VDKYGYEFLTQFAAQQPTYLCEGFPQLMAMGFAGANATHLVAPAGIAAIAFDNSSIPQFAFPADNDPFATYAMYAAIFQQAKRPETAKLYVNWLLERESPVGA
jgi:ABC-type Fe3+ transport system substrate-binding protein